jgi:hypothetical protein
MFYWLLAAGACAIPVIAVFPSAMLYELLDEAEP